MRTLETMDPKESLPYLKHLFYPPYITLAHIFHAKEGWELPRRQFLQYQFQYAVQGSAVFEIEGRTFTTNRGDLVVVYPYQSHSVTTIPGEPYVCISLVFHFGETDFSLKELLKGTNDVGTFLDEPIVQYLTQIPVLIRQSSRSSQLTAQGLLSLVIAQLIQHAEKHRDPSPKKLKNKTNMQRVEHFIQQHFAEEITLEQLEQIAGFSRNHLINQYRSLFQVTPFEHIRLLRVRKAKQLALESKMSIGEIAEVVGYHNVHAFSKMFKKVTGISLSQFCSSLVINKPE